MDISFHLPFAKSFCRPGIEPVSLFFICFRREGIELSRVTSKSIHGMTSKTMSCSLCISIICVLDAIPGRIFVTVICSLVSSGRFSNDTRPVNMKLKRLSLNIKNNSLNLVQTKFSNWLESTCVQTVNFVTI